MPGPRLLYWFRTPPGVKVGRQPFDEATRRALEAQNPGMTFDWETIVSTPIPAPIVDWRSRRRADRAAKAGTRVAPAVEASSETDEGKPEELAGVDSEAQVKADLAESPAPPVAVPAESRAATGPESDRAVTEATNQPVGSRRRRRRGGRGRRGGSSGSA